MAPPKFGDIGKVGKDLLTEDYSVNSKVQVKTKLEAGPAIKSVFTRTGKDGPIGAELELKHKIAALEVTGKVDHSGVTSLVFEHGSLLPNLKLKGDVNVSKAALKVSADYKHDALMTCLAYDVSKSDLTASTVCNFNSIALGASTRVNVSKSSVSTPDISAQYTGKNYSLTAHLLGLKSGSLTFHQDVNKDVAVALQLTKGEKDTSPLGMALGTSYQIDKDSSVKGKVDNLGILSAVYVQKIRPQMTLKVVGELNSTNMDQKIGVSLLMDY